MKIYVNYDCDDHNRIRGVRTLKHYLDQGKTEEEINAAMLDRNKECGWEIFRSFDISDELCEVFQFMLGEKEYKRYVDMTYVYDKLKEMEADLTSICEDVSNMSGCIEGVVKDVEKLIPEDDKY